MELAKTGSFLGGTLLVAGTAIGGGMLALPVLTAPGGFFPSILIYFLCWIFMACTGLLLVEIFLWNKEETNLFSMANMTLGRGGKFVTLILYLFLFYSLSVAYVAGGGNIVNDLFEALFNAKPACYWGPLLFVLLFAPFVAISPSATTRMNGILMIGLIVSFIVFVVLGVPHIKAHYLTKSNLALALLATPVVFTSFGFQGIVPTLTNYLGRDPFLTRKVIMLGTGFPFICYIIWEGLILGVVPPEGLQEALELGQSSVYPLKKILDIPWLFCVGEFFAFFAIVTSFFGVTLGLLDFLSDGLKIKKNFKGRVFLSFLIFAPALGFAMTNPCIFLNALHYAGGFGCALLLGLMPLLMAWRGRYALNLQSTELVPGGKLVLSLLLLFIIFELAAMILPLVAKI